MWDVVFPMESSSFCAALHTQERSVGDRRKFGGNGDDHFRGRPLLRGVVAREPVAVVFVFSLGPGLDGLPRIVAVGTDEMKPQLGRGHSISNRNFDRSAPLDGSSPANFDLAAGVFE